MTANQPRSLRIDKSPERGGWVVELDGHDIARALVGLSVRLTGDPVATATLDVIAEELPAQMGEVQVYLPDATKELLVRLGWTPPAEEAQS
ncbi:hypothetical protein [Streptomyces murinus]|uniref:hypothetical protein n=1 Tax=Streptomyces murinus TaxID=33900 RepID=UPI00380DA954